MGNLKFTETKLKGAYSIDPVTRGDERGFFARTFCANEFAEHGLQTNFVQTNMSRSTEKGILRGMHFQTQGAEESKLIRVTKGKILDVIIDIRKDSPTYCEHIAVELSDENHKMLYVPEGFAHGFLTLTDLVEVNYQVSAFYSPGKEAGIRWNDPLFGIDWPIDNPLLSEKDGAHPDFVR
ncbi:MAG: dTDP-4-dehydrorhamnose 3,5-epimerase [Cyclobacteriaceae bacterium]